MDDYLLSSEELDEFLNGTLEVSSAFIESHPDTEALPTLIVKVCHSDGEMSNHMFVFEDFDESRFDLFHEIGSKFGTVGAFVPAISFSSEGWMSTIANASAELFESMGGIPIPPSKDPDKIEVLIAAAMTVDRHSSMKILKLKREDGTVSLEPYNADSFSEPNSNLLSSFYMGYIAAFLDRGKEKS